MSIWSVVENLGQTISGAIGEAIDTAVTFVNDLPESETPDSIYMESDDCDLVTLGLESKEVQQRCWDRLNKELREARSYEVIHYNPEPESQSATESQSPLSSAMHRFLNRPNPLIKTINAERAAPDVEACLPWFIGGDSECMNEADEFLPLIGTVTIAAGAVAAGAAIAGAGTMTVITEATPYTIPEYIPWIAW